MQTLFGIDLSTGQKWIIAFAVILALLALLGLFARQIKGGRLRVKGQGGTRARQPRLGVVDIHDLDRQRQLILIRRDNVEHLIMIGGVTDVVVETNIVRSGARASTQPQLDAFAPERPMAHEPLPPVEPYRAEPAAPQQVAMPPDAGIARSRSNAAPPVPPQGPLSIEAAVAAAAVAPAIAAAVQAPTPVVQPPSFARDHAPSPAASAVELDSMARQLEEALKRPHSAVRPSNPAPEPAFEPAPVSSSVVLPRLPIEHAVEAPPPQPVVPAPVAIAPQDVVVRSVPLPADVEAELEFVLGLKPERVVPAASPFSPPAPEPEPQPVTAPEANPISAEHLASIFQSIVAEPASPAPVLPEKEDVAPAAAEPVAETLADALEAAIAFPADPIDLAPELVIPAPREPEPAPEASDAPAAPEPEPKPESEPVPEPPLPEPKPAAIDPFSVDAIEAEFARLLGRDPKAKS